MMSRFFRYIIIAILFIVTGIFLSSCEREKPETEPVIRPVRYLKVTSSRSDTTRTFAGVAQRGDKAALSFRVGGKVDSLPIKVGDRLKEGDMIATLDPADFEIKVQEKEAELVKARAQERNALANYERVRLLYENRNASLNDLDIARAEAESKKAAVESIKKQIDLAKRELSYTELRAPISCSIATKEVEINENVRSGQAVITADCGTWDEVKADVPERFISEIKDGMRTVVTFDAIPKRKFSAVVTEVGVAATGTATTFPVTARLTNTSPNVRSGMAAQVTIRFRPSKGRIVVPLQSVGEDRNGRFVFILEKREENRGIVKRRAVKVGGLEQVKINLVEPLGTGVVEGIEILDGLESGELIVTAGLKRLQDGFAVKLLEQKEK